MVKCILPETSWNYSKNLSVPSMEIFWDVLHFLLREEGVLHLSLFFPIDMYMYSYMYSSRSIRFHCVQHFSMSSGCNMTSQLFTEPTGSTCIMVLLFVLAAMATMPTHEMQKTGVFRGKSSVSSFCLFCGAMLWLQAILSILKPWTQSRLGEVIDNWMCIQMKVGGYQSWWPNPGKEAAG